MSVGLIGCFAAFALETDEMAGTKQGLSRDQVLHWEKHQVGTKSGTKLGPSQTGRKGASRASLQMHLNYARCMGHGS